MEEIITAEDVLAALNGHLPGHLISAAYAQQNNEGCGYPTGDNSDELSELHYLGEYIGSYRSNSTSEIAVYRSGESLVLVGDPCGPWAVSL